MSQALYRKYRSKALAEVVGQNHITDILSRALQSGRVAHAYLFTGPRGVGKTSIARILAHEINQLPYTEESQHLDIIEIDAASNNGVDDVRDLREKVQIAPVSASKKVYIIDEVHMLSKQAFNALLKTLEEPPQHIVFILATTDVEKLPATIISRTQRYAFRAITQADAVKHLQYIAKEEKINVTSDALELIAERGDGSFRDSISLLDQLTSLAPKGEKITAALIQQSLGLAPSATINDILTAIEQHDVSQVAAMLLQVEADGIGPVVFNSQLVGVVRKLVPTKPQLLPLLDALLDVPKSSNPTIKLLSVLGTAAMNQKPKTAALAAPTLEVSATIQELSEQATKPHPSEAAVQAKVPTAPAPQATKPAVVAQPKPQVPAYTGPFNWDALVAYTKANYVALYSVVSKCGYEIVGEKLLLYCQNAFYKKKLDDAKYSAHLYDSLKATGGSALVVDTIPTGAPMKDSQAAAIADIMGGGIEVAPEAA